MASETSSSVTGTMFGQELVSNGGAEGSSFLITRHKLTGHNYHQWAKAVLMFITGKAKETYSDSDNTADLFDIKGALHDLRQGEMTVTHYYNTLSRFWQQLDVFETMDWECPGDAKVRREESRKKLMMGTRPFSNVQEGSALISQGSTNIQEGTALVSRGSTYDARQKKGRPWCDHCRRPGHTKETCWKIHGKPTDWKSNKEKEARAFVADPEGKKEVPMILLSLAKNKWSGCKRCLAKDHPLTPLSQPDPLLREQAYSRPKIVWLNSLPLIVCFRICFEDDDWQC
ncbi:hypothetical protein CK203_039746 [Vitis vinifera]|uniref:Retrotransposon Copia-like N-terminal domain-containing protein n=1 Tax=Vitis vinifera TaxID=29760 RepID=A0A438HU20_VITVI|nr:hypothetical protein CK203_039746 [Vitis vinifera]